MSSSPPASPTRTTLNIDDDLRDDESVLHSGVAPGLALGLAFTQVLIVSFAEIAFEFDLSPAVNDTFGHIFHALGFLSCLCGSELPEF